MTNKIKSSNLDEDIVTGFTELAESRADGDFVIIYDSSAGTLKKIQASNLGILAPTVSSVTPTNVLTGDGTGNATFTITGTNFSVGSSAVLVTDGGTEVAFDTVTRDSSTQITGVIAISNLSNANEPYDVKVVNGSGLSNTLTNQINIDAQPVFSTAAGSLYSGSVAGYSNITIAAADPESGGDVTYTLESGSLPTGLSGTSTSSGYVVSGTPTAPGSDTTSTFTIRAADVNSNTTDREFSITINAPVSESFTSSGTFSVPAGVTSVDVLVVAGGGGGATAHSGSGSGGGGAGGLIFRPGFPVTPGGTVTVTVGCGAGPSTAPGNKAGNTGQDSVFGTLTAKGGGGGSYGEGQAGINGGSGGGGGYNSPVNAGDSIQTTQPGDSGTYGFGTSGGQGGGTSGAGGGGGGGAGQPGQGGSVGPNGAGGVGGNGKAYTISDGTTSVYYAGGGGGTAGGCGPSGAGGQGGGGDADRGGNGQPGTANRGGGGGATRSAYDSGGGGKGIVIVRY
jgi:hypothetical protein